MAISGGKQFPKPHTWNQSECAVFTSPCENWSEVLIRWPRPNVSLRQERYKTSCHQPSHCKLFRAHSVVCRVHLSSYLMLVGTCSAENDFFLLVHLIDVKLHYLFHLSCPILCSRQKEPGKHL